MKITVTGAGVCCGAGGSMKELGENLMAGKCMLTECDSFDITAFSTAYVGEVKDVKGDRFRFLADKAIGEMMDSAKIPSRSLSGFGRKCGVFLASNFFMEEADFERKPLSGFYDNIDYLKNKLGVDRIEVLPSACAAFHLALNMASDYIRAGMLDYAVVGCIETLTVQNFLGFQSLQNVSFAKCTPFSKDRDGLNLGEGAFFCFLETESTACARKADILCDVLGYASRNDCKYETRMDAAGKTVASCISSVFKDAEVFPNDVDCMVFHGTGTEANDAVEYDGVSLVFKDVNKDIWGLSSKWTTGHCLTASGGVEFAVSLIMLEKQMYFGMPYLDNPIDTNKVRFDRSNFPLDIKTILMNDIGFFGFFSSIIIGLHENRS